MSRNRWRRRDGIHNAPGGGGQTTQYLLDRETCQIKIAAPCRRRLPCRVSVISLPFSLFALNMTRTYARLCGVFGTGRPKVVACGMWVAWKRLGWPCLPCPVLPVGAVDVCTDDGRAAVGCCCCCRPDKEGRQLRWGLGGVPIEGRHSVLRSPSRMLRLYVVWDL